MSKLVVVFDPHCWPHKRHGGALVKGINRRAALCLDVLRKAIVVANANNAPLIVAGDLIDSAGPVQPQFAAALRSILSSVRDETILLPGNHDMTSGEDHSLHIYETSNVCTFEGIAHFKESIIVPFHCDIHDERVRDVPLLVAHFGVYDDSFSPWCKRAKDAWHVDALFSFMKERNVKCCLNGDWHSRKVWKHDGHVASLLDEGRQEWISAGQMSRQRPMLDLDGSEAERVWSFYNQRRQTAVPTHTGLAELERAVSKRLSDRPPLLQSALRESGAHGSGFPSDEYTSWREQPSQKCSKEPLSSGAPLYRGKHLSPCSNSDLETMQAMCSGAVQKETMIIMQGGALCATGWDNPGLHGYGTVALWDTDEHRLSWQELPGPRFCVARSDEEEASIVAEAQRLGHNLFLRRYYSGDRPVAPQCPTIEAYEALPLRVKTAALRAASKAGYKEPKLELERLVSEWLEQFDDDKEALEAHVRRYL